MTDDNRKEDITCPFCGERGFDLVGLKTHIQVYCADFEKVDNLPRSIFQ